MTRPLPLGVWLGIFAATTFLVSMAMHVSGVPGWLRSGWSIVAGFMFGRALAREMIRRAKERSGR